MAIIWADSADKHGIDRDDALHAMLDPYLRLPEYGEPHQEGSGRSDLYIGPPRQLGGPLLEILVERIPPRDLVVFHVMEARPKFLALLEEGDSQ